MSAPGFHHPLRIDKVLTVGVAKCRVDVSDLTESDSASDVLSFNALALGHGESPVPANARPMFAWVNIIEPFSGGDAASCTVELGDAGDDDELIEAVSVFTGASGMLPKTGSYTLGTFEAAYDPIITMTVTGSGATLDALEAGAIEVCIQYEAISTASVTS